MVTLLEEIDPEYYKDFIYTDKRENKCIYKEAKKGYLWNTRGVSTLFVGEFK